jgi:ketosteroid isomerase-like protein
VTESEQLERMRAAFEAWNSGDFEATLGYIREDVIWRPGGLLPGIDPAYEGHDGLRRFWREFNEPWETISIELEHVIEEREGMLLVVARFKARGRDGIEVDAPFFQLYLYDEEGLVREFNAFGDEAEARRASRVDG